MFNSFKSIPFYCYLMTMAATIIIVGVEWDISWHSSIGRDTFWSPPHMAIYFGGILAGLTSSYIVLSNTFLNNSTKPTVTFWGFKGPMSCWITIWGAIAMLTSAPFDDWWHNAYGLDVQILSPPHVVLSLGIAAIIFGSVLSILSEKNKIKHKNLSGYNILYIYTSSLLILMVSILLTEDSFLNKQHTIQFYQKSLVLLPVFLFALFTPSKYKWTFTSIAFFYMMHRMILIWVLPFFDAEPMLTPIKRHIDYFVVPPFPLLLIIPGICIDYIRLQTKNINFWVKNLYYGLIFSISFFIVHWYSSILLLSNFGRNWFFGTGKTIPYFISGNKYVDLASTDGKRYTKVGENYLDGSGDVVNLINPESNDYIFWFYDKTSYGDLIIMDPISIQGLLVVTVLCIFSTTIGSLFGKWLSKVKR